MFVNNFTKIYNNLVNRWTKSVLSVKTDSNNNSLMCKRFIKTSRDPEKIRQTKLKSTLYYVTGAGVLAVGLSYAAVPLYRMFCQAYSYGGTTGDQHDGSKVEGMQRIANREIKIQFNADIGASMRWNFKPQQYEIKVENLK